MATLAELHARLALDLNRDDLGAGGELEQAKLDAVAEAVEAYADELFWFNRASGTVATAASSATVALPAGMRLVQAVSCDGRLLARVPLEDIAYRTEAGRPTHWAMNDGTIQLWPVPNAVHALAVSGVAELGLPALGASNGWTTEAYRLILNEAKMSLCAGPLRDPEGMALARSMRDDSLARLRRDSRTRAQAPLRTDLPAGRGFNIVEGG